MIERMLCKVEGFVFGVTFVVAGCLAYARYMDIRNKEAESEEGGDATHYANGKEFHINGCDSD